LAVRVMGAAFLTSGTVVVAIRISLALKLFDYSKNRVVGNLRRDQMLTPLDAKGTGWVA